MPPSDFPRVAYLLKRYPRFSETFIVNEILAHERAGMPVQIFALRKVKEAHYQSILSQVRSPVTYISDSVPELEIFWSTLNEAHRAIPDLWRTIEEVGPCEVLDIYQAVMLACRVRELGIEHLHAHFGTVATTIARLVAQFTGISYTFTAHAKDIFHAEVESDELRNKLRDAASVVTVSDYNNRWLRSQYNEAASRVRRIYNGLTLSDFPYRQPIDRPPQILAVGRLVEKKGFDTLIEACAILQSREVAFHCTIIGDGPQKEALNGMIMDRGLSSAVSLKGSRPQNDVLDELHGAAVFAAPCVMATDGDRDGLPTVLLEAMASGTPCVSTHVTGIPEVIREEETGLLVPQRDPVALANAIARLLNDVDLRVDLSQRARCLIEQDFDVDSNAAKLRALFGQAVASREIVLRAVG